MLILSDYMKRIITVISSLLTLWAFIGVVSVLFFGSEPTSAIVASRCAGWAYLGTVGEESKFNFVLVDNQGPLITKGTKLKVRKGMSVNLRADYFSPLWWIPFVGQPESLGVLEQGEEVRVEDVRSVIKLRLWILVVRTNCAPKSPA